MSLNFKLFKETDEIDKWHSTINSFSNWNIFFEYDYLNLYRSKSQKPVLAFLESDHGKVAYPFMLRDIAFDQGLIGKIKPNTYFDISNAYGYSGHLIETSQDGSRSELLSQFYSYMSELCKEFNIVSEFVKFSPLLKNHHGLENYLNVDFLKKMVVTNLQDFGNPIYGELKKRKRRDARKCGKLGLEVRFDTIPKSFDRHFEIYRETMLRKDANDFFMFSKEFFKSIFYSLEENILLANVYLDDILIGFELCFLHGDFMYAHLASTDPRYLSYSPNDLSTFAIIDWGHKHGYHYYFAGGGLSNSQDDSLYLYKKAFAKNSDFDLHVGKKIWDSENYRFLSELSGKSSNKNDSFFPAYRK